MTNLTFSDISEKNFLLYKYIRGSHLYGLNTENSDVDTGGVFYVPVEQLIGMGYDYVGEISDEKHDNVLYELKKYFTLLCSSNPTMLESLFVDDAHVLFETEIMKNIRSHKEMFLSKKIFMPFVGYAESQIKKATGLHKLCQCPITTRKTPMDFCFTYYKQGSTSIEQFLARRGMRQEFCGLVNTNNMRDSYCVFYDWGMQFEKDAITYSDLIAAYRQKDENNPIYNMVVLIIKTYELKVSENDTTQLSDWYEKYNRMFFYRGIQKENGNDIRYSSVVKDEPPICYMTYNRDGYVSHCKKYKEYQEWVNKRNVVRYEENKEKTWDSKNVMHCIRLLSMAEEILNGDGVILNRKIAGDYEFLMKIRNHEFEYDFIIDFMNKKLNSVKSAYTSTKLKDSIDTCFMNDLLIETRRKLLF